METVNLLKLAPTNSAIFLLPSETQVAVIQTEPSLAITCLIPPRTQTVKLDYWKGSNNNQSLVQTEIQTPALLWTQLFIRWKRAHNPQESARFCRCFICSFPESLELKYRNYNDDRNCYRFFVYAIDLTKSTDSYIWAAPYTIANNDHGYVCWGSIPYPYSLRKAQVDYWQSIHNNSPDKYPINPSCASPSEELARFIRDFKPTVWGNYTSFVLGSKYQYSAEAPTGILISFDPQLSQYSEAIDHKVFTGFAYHSENGWRIKSRNVEFEISSDIIIR